MKNKKIVGFIILFAILIQFLFPSIISFSSSIEFNDDVTLKSSDLNAELISESQYTTRWDFIDRDKLLTQDYLEHFDSIDEDWILTGNRNYASYANLKPGKYAFKVIASNNDGIWNHEGVTLDIIIHPPPWFAW